MISYIYGGSFNPPTRAHIEIIKTAISNLGRDDKLYVIPNSDNYCYGGKSLAKIEDRESMLELGLKDVINEQTLTNLQLAKRLIIKDFGIDCKNTYLYDVLSKNFNIDDDFDFDDFDEHSVCLIIGDDCLDDLKKWKNIDKYIDKVYFHIILRNEEDYCALEDKCNNIFPNCNFSFLSVNELNNLGKISSSSYRKTKCDLMLNPSIAEYIKENHLYEDDN